MIRIIKKRIKNYFLKRKALKKWKEEKKQKWFNEGLTLKEINKKLKKHKIKF